jgi:hypothetical protein
VTEPPPQRGAGGCALALAIGVVTVVAVTGAHSLVTEKPVNLSEEWGVFLFQMLLVALPFALLAVAGIDRRLPWLIGLGLTAAFWGYYLFEGLRYHLSGDRSGVNLALAFAMLASPIFISAACLIAAKAGGRRA